MIAAELAEIWTILENTGASHLKFHPGNNVTQKFTNIDYSDYLGDSDSTGKKWRYAVTLPITEYTDVCYWRQCCSSFLIFLTNGATQSSQLSNWTTAPPQKVMKRTSHTNAQNCPDTFPHRLRNVTELLTFYAVFRSYIKTLFRYLFQKCCENFRLKNQVSDFYTSKPLSSLMSKT